MTFSKTLFWSTCSVIASAATSFAADQIMQASGVTAASGEQRTPAAISSESPQGVIPVTAEVKSIPQISESRTPFVSLVQANSLNGWIVQEGKQAAWSVKDGEISCNSASGGWLRTESEYSDFELKVEYRLQPGGNTGIGLRCPPTGNPTFTGIEIQLLDDNAPKYSQLRADQYTGSIYYQVAAAKKAPQKSIGEWNTCEIRCEGDLLTVRINGEHVNEIQLNRVDKNHPDGGTSKGRYLLSERPPIGHIALQSHSTKVDFRNVLLKDLAVKTPSGLQIVDLATGNGATAEEPTSVTVHYVGQLPDGKRFTDTRDGGEPVTVPVASVIPGWKEGLQGMKIGGRRRLIVPPSLGYGEAGVANIIPPGAKLVFEVELCGFSR